MIILLLILCLAIALTGPLAVNIAHKVIFNESLTQRARMLLILVPPGIITAAAIIFSLVLMSSTAHLPESLQEIPNTITRGNQIGFAWVITVSFAAIYFGVLNSCMSHFGNKNLPEEDES